LKDTAYYHRAYKTLARPGRGATLALVLLVLALDALVLLGHAELLGAVVGWARDALRPCGLAAEVRAWAFLPPLLPELPVLDTACVFPTARAALLNFAGALLAVLLLPHLRPVPKVIRVYLFFLGLLNAVAATFFILSPHRFPYDIAEFSLLYLGIELGIWLLLPPLLAVVLAPLPGGLTSKALVVVFTLAYSIGFGAVRYAAFLYLLHELSVLHMAAVFFALGPLLDFVYVVAIYSIYLNVLALHLRRRPETWRWLFSS
jgi:hypothetical protein